MASVSERPVRVNGIDLPLAGVAAGLPQRRLSWYVLWFLFPGVAERVLPADDWALYRRWIWSGVQPGQDPDLDRQLADLSRPGALEAGLNWYRANNDPAVFPADDPTLSEAQMTRSADYVTGPWRYERLDGVDHWVPVHAPEQLNRLLLEFLGTT
jgi:pimeloyl-ACP methyl ester carboxylesterase